MDLPKLQASDTPHEKVLSKSLLGWDTSVHLIYKCCIENMQAEHIAKKRTAELLCRGLLGVCSECRVVEIEG